MTNPFRSIWNLRRQIFIETAFSRSTAGRLLFTPFGVRGPAFHVEGDEDLDRLWRGLTYLSWPAAVICLGTFALWPVSHFLSAAMLWQITGGIIASFIVWTIAFSLWAVVAGKRLVRAQRDDSKNTVGKRQQTSARPFADSPTRAEPPLPRIAGKHVLEKLLETARDERGVQIEPLLLKLGSLAGFACQLSLREQARREERDPPLIAVAAGNRSFYFGDALNLPLAEGPQSVWAIVSEVPRRLMSPLPDLAEIFAHVSASIGTPEFGVPRLAGPLTADLPTNYVRSSWPLAVSLLRAHCDAPSQWPAALAVAAQDAIVMAEDVLDPGLAARIVMESAVPMSKLDPAEVGVAL